MSSKQRVVFSGISALLVALVIIFAATFAGLPAVQNGLLGSTATNVPGSNAATGSFQQTTSSLIRQTSSYGPQQTISGGTQSASTPQQGTSSSGQGSVSTGTSSAAGPPTPGLLSVLLTDPPVMPAGVTAINIEYDSLAIHSAGSSQAQGWVPLNSSGRIDLLGTVNRSQTIAVTQIRSGAYDQLRLVINSSVLTFDGRNYPAFVSTGALSFPIEGRFEVNGSQSAATIINFNPTVLNIGSAAVPQFLMQADAAAYPVPPTAVSPSMTSVGARTSLTGMTWWRSVQSEFSRSIKITSVRLSNGGLSFTLQNTGSQTSNLKIVMVTPVNMQASVSAAASPVFQGSAVFVLQPDGSLHRVPSNTSLVGPSTLPFIQLFQSAGYLLPAAGTFTSSYSGSLQGVVSGHAYEVIVMGDGVAAVYVVQAS